MELGEIPILNRICVIRISKTNVTSINRSHKNEFFWQSKYLVMAKFAFLSSQIQKLTHGAMLYIRL